MTACPSPHLLVVENGSLSTAVLCRRLKSLGATICIIDCERLSEHSGIAADGVVLTGTDVPAPANRYDAELELIRGCKLPLLGVCGGLHLIGRAYGVPIAPAPVTVGRAKTQVNTSVPLFAGLPGELTLFERHRYQLDAVPCGFERIASTTTCAIAGIRAPAQELYGLQAHVEFRRDGAEVLSNFLAIVRRSRAQTRPAASLNAASGVED